MAPKARRRRRAEEGLGNRTFLVVVKNNHSYFLFVTENDVVKSQLTLLPLGASSLFLDPYASDIAAAEGFGFGRVGKGGVGGGGVGGGAVAFSPELRGHGGDSHQHHLGEGEEDQVIRNKFFEKKTEY